MSSGRRPPIRGTAFVAGLMALGAVAFLFLRGRRNAMVAGRTAPEWPPFEPRVVPPAAPDSGPLAPATEPAGAEPAWITPGANGDTPPTHPVKVKVSSGIYHLPGGRFYERTTADRLYPSADAAEADGYRPSKS